MIINRVPELMAEKFGGKENINLLQVQRETGLTYSTVARWAKDRIDRVDFPVMEIWCEYFHCTPGDILIYVPDPPAEGELETT